ncbi:MAG: hypothetical protein HDR38_04155 [Treponema sp.]|nr:hypothetical protein [Treponema sp.]
MRTSFILLFSALFFPLVARPNVRLDSYYRLWGSVTLRSQADFSAESVQFVTLNHEGGLPVKVLEAGADATHDGADGTWFLVMTTSWTWAQDETRVPQYGKFWVFLCDDDRIQAVR